jgi:hypothetical protein
MTKVSITIMACHCLTLPTDKIESSPNYTQIMLELSSNNPVFQVADSEEEALDLILANISPLPQEDRLANLQAHASQHLIASGPKRLAPTIKNTSLILKVIELYKYSQNWYGGGPTANQLYEWRMAVSPVSFFFFFFLHHSTSAVSSFYFSLSRLL